MRRIAPIVGFLVFALALFLAWYNLAKRVGELERVCHGQCKYGDAGCAARCKVAGHCEAKGMDE